MKTAFYKKNQLLFFSFLFFLSCSTIESFYKEGAGVKKSPAKEADKEEQSQWLKIKAQKNKPLEEQIKEISLFISSHKDKDIVLEAYLLKAKLLLKNRKPEQACQNYHTVVNSSFYYKKSWQAYKASSQCYLKQGKTLQALGVLEKFIQDPGTGMEDKKRAAQKQWTLLKKQKLLTKWKLTTLSHLLLFSSQPQEKQKWKIKGERLVDALTEKELIAYAGRAKDFLFFEGYILYKAGQLFWENKDFSKAKIVFKESLSAPLSFRLKNQVQEKLSWIQKISKVNPYLIGVLVPLSGRKKALGDKVLKGLILGLDIEKDSPWQMVVLDSKSHPDVVRTHLDNLFYKHHVAGVIGGFTRETADIIAEKAEDFLIPALVFSQKEDLALDRKFVFQNAVTAPQLLTPLVEQSRKRLKIKKSAILYPEDFYGESYAERFSQIFTDQGGELVGKFSYRTGEVDFKKTIKDLLHLNVKGREKEFNRLKQELMKKNEALTERSQKLTPENVLPAKKDFEALFIPDSLGQVKKIVDHLKYFGVKDIYLLGTNLWSPNQKFFKTKDFSFVFINLPKKDNGFFHKSFISSFGYSPGLFEQRAYNAALFFKKALNQKRKSRLDFQKELKKIQHIPEGAYPFSLSREGLFQYPLHFYVRDSQNSHKLDSIPVK